ncbi:MAG: Octopine transport system permease protein OccQ [Alphaproteobacteria bacterium MarineAlpha5_Bin5]|nr:MAG: Octopine transport system permease protein OccQ [Alphaproteobacteria bacterium MarineAlpha5_Bin5]PPR51932.1 MAG: Octopine transport system permease protein OccQ [Alphaproteobacteria bacterium MarineAlpha5_Bin4]|tara:strand:- start:15572 stop:16276 length:705 start_codon:yes stop_codon:yes gene_type:complete
MFKFDKLVFGDLGWGDELLFATLMTLIVSILSMGLGLFLAIITVWAKIIQSRITRFIANFYTTVIRGVPELLVIYLIFFGGNAVVMSIAKIFGYNGYIELNALTIATIAIAFISATYSSEVLRAAYLSINKGQVEAAKALGLNRFSIFIRILAPQIIRYALPGIGNVWQITLKDTSLISVTGLVEIMRQSRIASNVEHSPLTFLITAALLYLFLTTFSGKFFKILEIKFSQGYN